MAHRVVPVFVVVGVDFQPGLQLEFTSFDSLTEGATRSCKVAFIGKEFAKKFPRAILKVAKGKRKEGLWSGRAQRSSS